ncbi:MAG: CDP-alcohol phosphatidyltransferase family protein [Oscillospiraceae bacterium]|nr:CDP-alcohol phosphatidyltransferase family protein [Oscillospiraceae bacterium]MDD4546867.1 CDP-alcohol phosphatidyltransferase family protein [Oscillospiraceae bacterium]
MRFFNIEWKMNIPNALSLLRIALLPVFVVFYINSQDNSTLAYWAFGVLVFSGITDSLDGIIARKFNQITDLGKLLDPLADKLTQVTVVICLALHHKAVVYLLVVCLVKEICQGLGGLILLKKGKKIRGAHWFGKVSTFTFYAVMFMIVGWLDMPYWLLITLVSLVALLMILAFLKYITLFFQIKKTDTDSVTKKDIQN